jgi:hypothetical protein
MTGEYNDFRGDECLGEIGAGSRITELQSLNSCIDTHV